MPMHPSIVMFPDPRLRAVAATVVAFGDDLRQSAADLVAAMQSVSAIGITAPHIGVPQRLVAIRPSASEPPRLYVNPRIVWASDETARHVEGSVSMPGVSEEIARPASVRVGYCDLEGVERTEEAHGFLAACHQHEIDQLDGIFWLQRLSALKRERAMRRFQKLRKRR